MHPQDVRLSQCTLKRKHRRDTQATGDKSGWGQSWQQGYCEYTKQKFQTSNVLQSCVHFLLAFALACLCFLSLSLSCQLCSLSKATAKATRGSKQRAKVVCISTQKYAGHVHRNIYIYMFIYLLAQQLVLTEVFIKLNSFEYPRTITNLKWGMQSCFVNM